MKVVIIGGGPAGMLSAISASQEENEVTIIEKMNQLGKKLCITGKGRCNITSSLPIEDFIKNIPGNGKFLYSAFKNFTNQDILKLLKEEGIQTKEERGNRIFPVSDRASDVRDALIKRLKKENVKIITNARVVDIIVKENTVQGVIYKTNSDSNKNANSSKNEQKIELKADKVILATGGNSYPLTGSNGDGYNLAKKLGHTVTEIRPSLVALVAKDEDIDVCQNLQGLSLKNVGLKVYRDNKMIYEDFGEMLFTHFGVSGPIILSSSAHLVRNSMENVQISIDLKPALDENKLDERILRDFNTEKNKEFKNSLNQLLPQKMIPVIVDKMGINKKVNEITKEERRKLVKLLKDFRIKIKGFRPVEEAIVTAGGINIKEINPKTMESKIVKGLYFAGEIIDVDAYTGGFNLQIAYSTGFTAGLN